MEELFDIGSAATSWSSLSSPITRRGESELVDSKVKIIDKRYNKVAFTGFTLLDEMFRCSLPPARVLEFVGKHDDRITQILHHIACVNALKQFNVVIVDVNGSISSRYLYQIIKSLLEVESTINLDPMDMRRYIENVLGRIQILRMNNPWQLIQYLSNLGDKNLPDCDIFLINNLHLLLTPYYPHANNVGNCVDSIISTIGMLLKSLNTIGILVIVSSVLAADKLSNTSNLGIGVKSLNRLLPDYLLNDIFDITIIVSSKDADSISGSLNDKSLLVVTTSVIQCTIYNRAPYHNSQPFEASLHLTQYF
jgi:hypothetical protein